MVIVVYTAPQASSSKLGALLLGYYADGQLRYAGKVGTGFDAANLRELGQTLRPLRRATSPFADAGSIKERDVTWVEPFLMTEVGFSEWNRHGRCAIRASSACASTTRPRRSCARPDLAAGSRAQLSRPWLAASAGNCCSSQELPSGSRK